MGSVGKCHSISDNHLCYNHTCFCVFMDTAVPASGGRLYKPKFFSTYCYLPIHPLCALSAFESLGCSQAAVLRDLRRGQVGLGAERTSWDTLPRKALSPFPSAVAACTYPGRSSKWNACCTVSRRGAAARSEDHTGWANHVLYHCALESPLDGPLWGRGESRPQACPRFRGLGSQSGPLIRTLVSILIFLVHRHFPRALCAVTLVLRNPS